MLYESQYYGIVDTNSPYLMHHGVKGQKWGVRRYQYEDGLLTPLGRQRLGYSQKSFKSAGQYKRALNRTDKERARADYEFKKSDRRISKYEKKLKKPGVEGNAKKQEKLKSKIEAEQSKRSDAKANLDTIKKTSDRIINDAVKNGYNVRSKTVVRDAKRATHIVATGIAGYGGLAVSSILVNSYSYGKKFKVSKVSDSSKASYKHDSDGYKNSKRSAKAKYIARKMITGW